MRFLEAGPFEFETASKAAGRGFGEVRLTSMPSLGERMRADELAKLTAAGAGCCSTA